MKGYTLTELLTALLVAGILAALGYPTILNQQNKARQAEAQATLGAIYRGQLAALHTEGQFAGNLGALGLGINDTTRNYSYEVEARREGLETSATASAERDGIESYTSAAVASREAGELQVGPPLVCRSQTRKRQKAPKPPFRNGRPRCPAGFKDKSAR